MVYFNPLDTFYKSNIGAVKEGDLIKFRLKGDFNECSFLYKRDGETESKFSVMEKKGDFFETEISFSRGLYGYCFKVNGDAYIGLGEDYLGALYGEPAPFQLTVFSDYFKIPENFCGGIIYQIFPDRFNRGIADKKAERGKILRSDIYGVPYFLPNSDGKVINNDFFGGDFKGIEQKLDYISSLGVTSIYLNPVFKAYSNHRYDTGDYMSFDPLLGTEEDFLSLVKSAKEKGISIILDGVFNHTGDDSVYFNKYGNYNSLGAYQSENSKYKSWYKFINYPEEYESWWGITVLPALNKENPDYVDFITGDGGVIEKYTKMGIGGWRLDVVDELPDAFVKKIRAAVKRVNKNAVVIGEVWEDATNKISYGVRREYFTGDELDSVMNYPLKDAILRFVRFGDSERLSYLVKEQMDHYPPCVLNILMNILSTHDTFRLLSAVGDTDVSFKSKKEQSETRLSGEELKKAIKRHKAAALLSYTLYGVPSVYYGDEIGMQGYTDPLNRAYFKWNETETELLDFYKKIGEIRRGYDLFKSGTTEIVFDSDGVFAFKRKECDSEIFIALNFGKCDVKLTFNGELKELITGKFYRNKFTLIPESFAVFCADKINGQNA